MRGMGTRGGTSGNVLDERRRYGVEGLVGMGRSWQFSACSRTDGIDVGVLRRYSEGCSNCDSVGVQWVGGDVNAIAHGQEGVESLNEVWVPGEEARNTLNNARGVYSA